MSNMLKQDFLCVFRTRAGSYTPSSTKWMKNVTTCRPKWAKQIKRSVVASCVVVVFRLLVVVSSQMFAAARILIFYPLNFWFGE